MTTTEPEAVEVDPAELSDDPMERAEARKARSRRPSIRLSESDKVGAPVADHKTSKAALAAQRKEAMDTEGKIECYVGEGDDEVTVYVDPDQFTIEFQMMLENGTPGRALLHVVGEEQMKLFIKQPAKNLEKIIKSLANQCGLGNS